MPDSREPGSGAHLASDELPPEAAQLDARLADLAGERDAARAEAQLVREAIEAMEEGIVVLDDEDRILFANASWLTLNGRAPWTAPGTPFIEVARGLARERRVVAPEGNAEAWTRERMAHHRQGAWRTVHQRDDGRWFDVNERMLGNGHCLLASRDITRFVGAQDELRRSEARLQGFAAAAAEWFWETDAEHRFTYMSPAIETVTGRSAEWHLGKRRDALLAESSKGEAWKTHLETLERREPFRGFVYERHVERRGSLWIAVSGEPVHDEDGRFVGYRGSGSDITAHVEAEQALIRSEARLSALLEHLPALVSVLTLDGRIVLANREFANWHGVDVDACVGEDMANLLPLAASEALRAECRAIALTGEAVRSEGEATSARGEGRHLLTVRFPVHDGSGAITTVGGISTDVSELKRVEDRIASHRDALEVELAKRSAELEASHAELLDQERLATLGRLTATVSHELRNPLGTIRTTMETLRRQLDGEAQAHERYLARIDRSVNRCVRLIDELLQYGRGRELALRSVTLDRWLTRALAEATAKVPEGVEVRMRLATGITVDIDPVRLQQAVRNVVENALQAMAERDEPGAPRVLTVGIEQRGERAHVTVRDTGPGISEEHRKRAFEPMFSTKSFGFGLGLPLVRRIMEQHGGGAEIGSADEGGCLVDLWLPVAGAVIC